jgi:arginyl-tRNA synthetase
VFLLEHPADSNYGDYATNVAMVLFNSVKDTYKSPRDFAEVISEKIREQEIGYIKNVSVAGTGFINISLTDTFFVDARAEILEKNKDYGKTYIHSGKKILVEHSSPNLFKPFHIGHLMNNTIGESIKRLMEYSGADVTAISFPSDVSLGIAKAVYILLEDGESVLETKESLRDKLTYLGDCYVRGTRAYDENEVAQKKVREIVQNLYKQTPSKELSLYKKGYDINVSYFREITARLGSVFSGFIFESEAGEVGKKIVKENTKPYGARVYEESDGAVIFKGEDHGLHTRVFLNKEENPTYEAKDTGLLSLKFSRYAPDLSLFITDHEQKEYFKVVKTAAGLIQKEWSEKTRHITHGRMTFKGQKMSSRLGGVPSAYDTLEAVKEAALEVSSGRVLDNTKESVADMIGIAGIKFTILKTAPGKNVNFDPDTSLSFDGDSGPYIQYTYVRSKSILEKADILNNAESIVHFTKTPLDTLLYRFPEIVELAQKEYAPHEVANYLLVLAQEFNSWYANTRILDEADADVRIQYLTVVQSTATILRNGLYLLGIQVPEKM